MISQERIEQNAVSRYTTLQRINHWVTAISLILLALTGFALFHPSLYWLTALFGGGSFVRMIHPWIGVVAFASFMVLFFRFMHLNVWNRDDTRWLMSIFRVISGKAGEEYAEVGKYNGGQKFIFWLMTYALVALIGSGIVMWDQYFGMNFAIETKRWAVLIHAVCAVAMMVIVIIHVYAAIWVRGTIRAMTQGNVTAGWAFKHHRKWLRQKARDEKSVAHPL